MESKTPLADYLKSQWLPFYAEQRRPASYVKRELDCRLHIVPHLGRLRLDRLTPRIVQVFYTDLSATLSPNTVRGVAGSLSAALSAAVRWELLDRNPCQGASPPPVPRREPSVWTPDQTRAFLAAESDPDWHCLWAVLAETGMRRGEALALRWRDVDWDAGTVRVERTITKAGPGKGQMVGPVKTERGRRVIALSAVCLGLLRDTRERRESGAGDKRAVLVGEVGFTRESIFPFPVDAVYDRFLALTVALGLPRIRPHDLRHGNVTAALEAGIPLIVISERLGHASIRITGDTYAHVTRRLDRESAEVIGGLLLGEGRNVGE